MLKWNIKVFDKKGTLKIGKQALRMGEVNAGMGINITYGSVFGNYSKFPVYFLLGKIPEGTYRLSLELTAESEQNAIYDALSLFAIEAASR